MTTPTAVNRDDVHRFAELHARYDQRLRSYIAAYLGRGHYQHADEVARDTWARALGVMHTLREPDEGAFGWLAGIARRTVVDRHHSRRRNSVPAESPPSPKRRRTPAGDLTGSRFRAAPANSRVEVAG